MIFDPGIINLESQAGVYWTPEGKPVFTSSQPRRSGYYRPRSSGRRGNRRNVRRRGSGKSHRQRIAQRRQRRERARRNPGRGNNKASRRVGRCRDIGPESKFSNQVPEDMKSVLQHSGGRIPGYKVSCFPSGLKNVLKGISRRAGKKIKIGSAYRDCHRNKRVGGARSSQHLKCNAADITVSGFGKSRLKKIAQASGAKGIGTYCGSTIHVDTGRRRQWNWGCRGKGKRGRAARAARGRYGKRRGR